MGEGPPLACLKVYMSGGLWGFKGDAPDQFGCHEDAHLLEGGDGTRGSPRSKTPAYRLSELKNVRPYRGDTAADAPRLNGVVLNGVAESERHSMQTKPSIIAVDMDGTFLTDSKTFDTERFSHILSRLQAQGIHFVVASGNTYAKLQDYMRGFEGRGLTYIAENGAYLADESGQLAVHPFEEEDVPRIIEVVQGLDHIGLLVCTTEGIYLPKDRCDQIVHMIRGYFEDTGQELPETLTLEDFAAFFFPGSVMVDSIEDFEGAPIKFPLLTPPKQTQQLSVYLREALPQTVTPMVSGFGAIDLVRTGVNKATGLKDLCERLDADPAGILAFGDGENDMEMLRYAGWGVAMSNAPEVVRNAADEVIGSNEEQAVLEYLEQLLNRLEASQ